MSSATLTSSSEVKHTASRRLSSIDDIRHELMVAKRSPTRNLQRVRVVGSAWRIGTNNGAKQSSSFETMAHAVCDEDTQVILGQHALQHKIHGWISISRI
jgi:hypothetical protein